MTDNAQRAQNLLVERIVSAIHPERIILFGSRARGDQRPDSDFDLLVILAEAVEQPWNLSCRLRAAVGVIGYGKDIIVANPQQILDEAGLNGSIIGIALREGRELWPHAA